MAYKRSIYLINPKFQLRFSVYVGLFILLSCSIYPFVIYDMSNNFMQQMNAMFPGRAVSIAEKQKEIMGFLLIWQILFSLLVFIICIFFSHKIAGPIYKVQKFLRAIRDGNPHGKLWFRKGDYFQEVADDFNDTFEQIQETYKNDFVYLSEVATYINNLSMVVPEDKKIVLAEITKKLNEIQHRFNESDEEE